jgi:hypothetical protein
LSTKNHGAEESFCLGIAEDYRASGHSEKSVELFNDPIDISGVPVDRRSADKWESVCLLAEDTVANSKQGDGLSLPHKPLSKKPNSAILNNNIDNTHAVMEAFMSAEWQSDIPCQAFQGDIDKAHTGMESFTRAGARHEGSERHSQHLSNEVGVGYVHDQQAPLTTHEVSLADDV